MTVSNHLYDADFYGWTQLQAQALREGKLENLDIENLIEEVESMGKSEQRELESRLEILIMHLIKWCYQSERRSVSWELTIKEQRARIDEHLYKNPSLKSKIDAANISSYRYATFGAARETLIHSSGQAGFAVLDAVQGANRRRSGATARICNAAMRQNPQMAAARGMDQRFPKETRLHISAFPSQCPWTFEEIMAPDFWPDPPQRPATSATV